MNIAPQQMEMFVASQIAENLGGSDRLMEMILERRNMFRALTREKRGIAHEDAVLCGNSRKKYWRMSKVKWVMFALPKEYFLSLGLFLPGK